MSVLENVIALLFQLEVFEVLVSGFLLLAIYLFASQFSRNHNRTRESRPEKTLTPDSL